MGVSLPEPIHRYNGKPTSETCMDPNSISQTFTSRPLDDAGKDLLEKSNMLFTRLEKLVNDLPPSRLRAIALTELEKTSLVVNKAISRKNDA
jgi:hypothetical protein